MPEKGSVALLPLLLILLVVGGLLVYFGVNNYLPTYNKPQTQSTTQQAVPLKTDYQNPFDKNNQYVNPFAEYKNPFDSLK